MNVVSIFVQTFTHFTCSLFECFVHLQIELRLDIWQKNPLVSVAAGDLCDSREQCTVSVSARKAGDTSMIFLGLIQVEFAMVTHPLG